MEFSGRLAAFPIGDILQGAQNDRRSGALVVRRSGSEKRVYYQDGAIVACISDEPTEFFGQHLLVRGLLDERRLVQALSYLSPPVVQAGSTDQPTPARLPIACGTALLTRERDTLWASGPGRK